jgi:hypothetical protein
VAFHIAELGGAPEDLEEGLGGEREKADRGTFPAC